MGYLDALKKVLKPELYSQVEAEIKEKDDFDDDWVPRARLDKVITQRNDLRTQLKATTSGGEDDDKSTGEGTKLGTVKIITQEDLDNAIKAVQDKAAETLQAEKKRLAVAETLRKSQVRKPELLIPQLDMTKVVMDSTGNLTGLSEQLDTWKKSDPYLFGDYVPSGTGAGGKEVPKSDRASLEQQQAAAVKAGNIPLSVALKRQIQELE